MRLAAAAPEPDKGVGLGGMFRLLPGEKPAEEPAAPVVSRFSLGQHHPSPARPPEPTRPPPAPPRISVTPASVAPDDVDPRLVVRWPAPPSAQPSPVPPPQVSPPPPAHAATEPGRDTSDGAGLFRRL